jgi:hypothetical protein
VGGGGGGEERERENQRKRERERERHRDEIHQIESEIEIDREIDRARERDEIHPRTENGCFRRRTKNKRQGKHRGCTGLKSCKTRGVLALETIEKMEEK